ncbi:MAG: PD40 domain-containing protein [Hymenobacteraceae bacterium]|nr:PD40 domain-containing protein [Hymenobacteraceae bacterium]
MPFSILLRRWALSALLMALGLGLVPGAAAQVTQEVFGPNRIQYRRFQWQIYGTANFNVYYYAGGQEVARNAAEFAEKELRRVSSLIGYYPYAKTTLLLYNSVADLRQSNIGLDDAHYQTGGETALSKNRIELAFDGRQPQFRRDLSYRLTRLLLQDMMYGGSLKDQLRSSYLLQLPPWFVDGAAAYVAEGWSTEMDDYIRSQVRHTSQRRLETILARNPRLAGQSLWNYVAERYGYTSLQNVLNLTRITRDEAIGFASSLNVPPRQFMRDWYTYYYQQSDQPPVPYAEVSPEQRLRPKNRRGLLYTEPVFSPDGRLLAYVENDRGTYRVRVRDVATGKERQLLRGGYKTPDQQVDVRMPLLAWRTATQLAVAEVRRGRVELRLKTLSGARADEEGLLTRLKLAVGLQKGSGALAGFEQILDLSYSADGKQLVFSGVRAGQSDIYLLRAGQRAARPLTNDVYDDLNPVFLPDGNLVFSSNRPATDSLGQDRGTFVRAVDNFDLFRVSLPDGATPRFRILTQGIANETRPRVLGADQVAFLSEESGVRSVWQLDLTSGQRRPLTGFGENIKTFDLSPQTAHLAFVFADQGREFVALYPAYAAAANLQLAKTVRQETLEDRAARATRAVVPKATPPISPPVVVAAADSAQRRKAPAVGINTDDYQFDAEPPKPRARRPKTPIAFAPPPPPLSAIAGPVPYDIRFATTDVVTSLYADPLLGTGLVGEVRMADVLENHRVRAGAFSLTDFRTNHVYGEYVYLGRRYDLKANYLKSTFLFNTETNQLRISRHAFTASAIYPLTHSLSLRLSPTVVATRLTVVDRLNVPDFTTNFGGGTAEAVFDNSIITGLNQMEGTRMKLGFLKLQAFGQPTENFSKVYFDGRHYQKIHRGLVWATRLSAGAFLGAAPKQFILGGVDNWIFTATRADDLQYSAIPADLFYQQFVLPLRGFPYGARTGPRHVALNTELRWPIVQYLAGNAPIGSGFFRNLQLIGFFDAGSAYSGGNPFTTDNSFNTQIINNGPFTATVINYRNPFLYGYGGGARTTLLGFYLKYDLGWGVQDGVELAPRHHFSLGYDF